MRGDVRDVAALPGLGSLRGDQPVRGLFAHQPRRRGDCCRATRRGTQPSPRALRRRRARPGAFARPLGLQPGQAERHCGSHQRGRPTTAARIGEGCRCTHRGRPGGSPGIAGPRLRRPRRRQSRDRPCFGDAVRLDRASQLLGRLGPDCRGRQRLPARQRGQGPCPRPCFGCAPKLPAGSRRRRGCDTHRAS